GRSAASAPGSGPLPRTRRAGSIPGRIAFRREFQPEVGRLRGGPFGSPERMDSSRLGRRPSARPETELLVLESRASAFGGCRARRAEALPSLRRRRAIVRRPRSPAHRRSLPSQEFPVITPLPFLATALLLASAAPVSRTQVVVDTAGLRQAGVEQLESTIETTGTMVDLNLREELKKRGVEVVDDPEAPRIEVALFWKDYRASHFSITVEIVRPDGARTPLPRFECKHCGNNDLLDRIHAELPVVLEQLEADPEPPPPPVVAPPPPPPETLLSPQDTATAPLGARGKAGISALV